MIDMMPSVNGRPDAGLGRGHDDQAGGADEETEGRQSRYSQGPHSRQTGLATAALGCRFMRQRGKGQVGGPFSRRMQRRQAVVVAAKRGEALGGDRWLGRGERGTQQ